LHDKEWSAVDGEVCKVIEFSPLVTSINESNQVQNGSKSLPYAVITIECKKLDSITRGYITHKIDFGNLWVAFNERYLDANEEIIVVWSKNNYKRGVKLLSGFMPKLWVMICPKGAYELMSDSNYKPELSGLARWNAMKPIIDWKPGVFK